MMKLSEQIAAEYDKADALSGRCDIPRGTLLGWKNEAAQIKEENEVLNSFEGWDTAHMLRLTADRLENPVHAEIMLANANYLRRMARLLTGEDDEKHS